MSAERKPVVFTLRKINSVNVAEFHSPLAPIESLVL
jgi:hypothetical protein